MMLHLPEEFRLNIDPHHPAYQEESNYFQIPSNPEGGTRPLDVIATVLDGWEVVSVLVRIHHFAYTPTAGELAMVRLLFWDEEDVVVQFYHSSLKLPDMHENSLQLFHGTEGQVKLPFAGEEEQDKERLM